MIQCKVKGIHFCVYFTMFFMNEVLQQKANVEWVTQMTKIWAHQKTTC